MSTLPTSTTMSRFPAPPLFSLPETTVAQSSRGERDKEFLAIVALLMAIAVLAINMILPAFDQITRYFGLSDTSQAGLTVSLLYLGLAIGQVVLGPASDTLGRRAALTIGVGTFLIGCLISGTAISFEMLIVGQIIQGIGLGAPRIITLAILRDRFSGNSMASAMSFVMMMFVIAPTFAPFVGALVVSAGGWRSLFIVYGLLGTGLMLLIALRLPETLPKDRRQVFSIRAIRHSQVSVVKNMQAMGYAICLGVVSGPFVAYLNSSQQIFEFQYQLGYFYPVVFAALSLWVGAASLTNGLIVQRAGMNLITTVALLLLVLASGLVSFTYLFIGTNPHWASSSSIWELRCFVSDFWSAI